MPAYCHLFVHDDDYLRLRSLAYADAIEPVMIKRILDYAFSPAPTAETTALMLRDEDYPSEGKRCVLLDIEQLEPELDVRKPVITTVLSYTMLHATRPIQLLPPVHLHYNLILYKFTKDQLVGKDPWLARLLADARETAESRNGLQVDTLASCRVLDCSPYQLHQQLYSYHGRQWFTVHPKREALHVRLERDHLNSENGGTPDVAAFMSLWSDINARMQALEQSSVLKIDQIYGLACAASIPSVQTASATQRTDTGLLNRGIHEYFHRRPDSKDGEKAAADANSVVSRLLRFHDQEQQPPVVQQLITVKQAIVQADVDAFVNQDGDRVHSGMFDLTHFLYSFTHEC